VTFDGPTFAAIVAGLIAGSAGLDALVRPRGAMRSMAGLWLLVCMAVALLGLFLALTGNGVMALALALAVQALFTVSSNAKHAMLGEPLLFSDLALVGAIFRHPQFYLSAVRLWQRAVAALIAVALVGAIGWFSHADPRAHLIGAALMIGGIGALAVSLSLRPWRTLAPVPDAAKDTGKLGLFPTMLLYWLRWRREKAPAACQPALRATPDEAPELIVVIQCESFADPVELFGDPALALPGLAAARGQAMQWGNLNVSGFGAYTMRTEYGVLFGRDEAALGFRRYDPFLTATQDAGYAMPARLREGGGDWRSLFVHPHDMRFYNRNTIMPAGGFAELVGEGHFAPPAPGEGRYVTDAAMADTILDLAGLNLAKGTAQPTLIYAVTIENHGPWAPDSRGGGSPDLVDGYMRLVRHGDAMLTRLVDGLAALRRPALLIFFGDHRPSIPGASVPPDARAATGRHTPYVMLRLDGAGKPVPGTNRRADLTPAQLHHAILDAALGAPVGQGGA